MADEEETGTEEETPETEETPESEETEEESEKKDDKDEPDPDLTKAIKRRDAALARARKAEAQLAKLKEKEEEGEDPVAKANTRLVNASARTVLASAGITDRDDQKEILAVLNLSDIDVSDDGPDEDAIEERIELLRSIFGGTKKTTNRVPASVKPKDRGNTETTTDPDAARYKRIMRGR